MAKGAAPSLVKELNMRGKILGVLLTVVFCLGMLTPVAAGTWNFGGGITKNTGTISSTNFCITIPGTAYLTGGGIVNFRGGSFYSSGGGALDSDNNIIGNGTFSAALINRGILTATANTYGNTLTVTGAVTHTGTTGDVFVGSGALDTATLALQNNLGAHNFTLNQAATLNVASGKTITLNGNFNNYANNTSQWQPAAGFNLVMTGNGSTFEVGGKDYGSVGTGFSSNFNLAILNLPATADLILEDLYNNGNQGGVHGTPEALYISSLTGSSGAVLDLNHLWCYVLQDGVPYALPDGLYNNVLVENSPVPIPGSVLLLGSGILGLAGWRRFRKS